MKKLIKILLTASMLVTCFTVNVFADTFTISENGKLSESGWEQKEHVSITVNANVNLTVDCFAILDSLSIGAGATVTIIPSDDEPYGFMINENGSLTIGDGADLTATHDDEKNDGLLDLPGVTVSGLDLWKRVPGDPDGEKITDSPITGGFSYDSGLSKWFLNEEEDGGEFGPTNDFPYVIHYHCGGGSVQISETISDENKLVDGENTTVRLPETVTSVVFTYTENEGNHLDGIWVEQDGDGDSGFVDLDIDPRHNAANKTFTLNLSDEKYNDPENANLKFVNMDFIFVGEGLGPTDDFPYVIHYHCSPGGSIEISNLTIENENKLVEGEEITIRLQNTVSNVVFSYTLNEGNKLDGIWIEQDGDNDDSRFVELNSDSRHDATNKTFTLDLTQTKYDDSEIAGFKFVNMDFNFVFLEDVNAANQRLAEKLNTLELAFDSTTGTDNNSKLKEYIANQIYEKYLNSGSRYHVENTVFKDDDFDTFKGKVIIVEDDTEPTKTPVQIDGANAEYFKFKLDGLASFVGIVYKLSDTDQFILRDGNSYTVIDVGTEGKKAEAGQDAEALKDFDAVKGGMIVVREVNNTVNKEESENVPNYEIFGNYAGFPMNYTGRMQDFQDTNFISIEQVMPCAGNGIDTTTFSGIGCEMILYAKNFLGVCVKSSEKAKPWSKENLPIYPTNSNKEEATVFYASESAIISTPYNAPKDSKINNVTFNDGTTSWNDCSIRGNEDGSFTVTFGSIFYDKVPLKITYTNGTSNTFVIARTGISIGDYPAPGDHREYVEICGEKVDLNDENKWVIAAPFYYASSSPQNSDRVSLFVRITEYDGTVATKLISNTINNSDIHTDDSGYTYNKYDVFELWRGTGENRPKEIEVLAFVQGNDDSFGGVKLGAGNGVKWTQERGRQ